MIRSLIRCPIQRICRHILQTQQRYIFPLMPQIASSPGQYKRNYSSQLAKKLTTKKSVVIPHDVDIQAMNRFTNLLQEKLNCSKEQAEEICVNNPDLLDNRGLAAMENLELLLHNGVRTDVILDNLRMLTRNCNQLRVNLDIIKDMKPKDINDFVALAQVSTRKLIKLKERAEEEAKIVPSGHRIYYISEAMNIEPCVVTKYLAIRLFLLNTPFEIMDRNLQIMLKYIAPIDILHDLWSFRYESDVIENRLNRAKQGDVKKLMPWMIRCPKKLERAIQLVAAKKAIVGEESSVKYLSDRLNFDVETTESMMQKHPQVYSVRVTRVKKVLDYLLDEAGFSPKEIAQTPRIFCHALQTTKKRLDELKSLGCRAYALSVVCKSKREYVKFIKNWKSVRERCKKV